MAERTQEELQSQLAQLGWTIGPQEKYSRDEVIPLRQLATITLREEKMPQKPLNPLEPSPESPPETVATLASHPKTCTVLPTSPTLTTTQIGIKSKPNKQRKLPLVRSNKNVC